MNDEKELATTIAQLDVHLGYLRDSVGKIEGRLALMATKADIDDLKRQLGGYVPRAEFEAARKEWAEKSVGTTFDRIANVIIKLGGAAAVIAAAANLIVLLLDKGPK